MDTNALSVFSYNGNDITFNSEDGIMVNATEMAKPFGKRPNDYLNLPSTKELIECVTRKYGITQDQLIKTIKGNFSDGSQQGTWMQEDLALDFAQWLSVDFRLWCNDRIKELLKKGYVIANPDSFAGQNELLNTKKENLLLIGKVNELQKKLDDIDLKEQKRIANSYKVFNDLTAEKMLLQSRMEDSDTYLKDFFVRFYKVQVNYGHLLQVKRAAKAIRKLIGDISDMLDYPDPELPDFKETKDYIGKVKKQDK